MKLQVLLSLAAVTWAGSSVLAEESSAFLVTTNGTTVTALRTNDLENAQLTQSFPDGDIVRKLILTRYNSTPCCFFPTEDSALPDGIDIQLGQWRIRRAGALGTGPVTLGTASNPAQLVNDQGGVMDVTNKLIAANTDSQILATSASHYFILRSLGVANGVAGPKIGRTSGVSRMTLALTEESNDYLGNIFVMGALSPFAIDGGTNRIAANASSPFFSYVGRAEDKANARFEATDKPFTIDAKPGADVSFGLPLDLQGRAVDTYLADEDQVPNGNFEEDSGWTWSKADSSAGNKVGRSVNGGGNATTYLKAGCNTPCGENFYILRCLHKITSTGTVKINEAADNWYVSLYAVPRNQSANNSHLIALTIRLTNTSSKKVYAATLPALSQSLDAFKQFKVGPYDLPAGEYTVEIETSWPGESADQNKWSAYAVDNIQMFRSVYTANKVVKTGEGRVALDGVTAKNTQLEVEGGTLGLKQCSADGVVATVKAGGAFELGPEVARQNGLTVNVAEGGAFALNELAGQLVKNGSFEADGLHSFEKWTPTSWTWTVVAANAGNGNGSGLQQNGGTVTPSGPNTDYGQMTAYLRSSYRLSQTVQVPADGTYRFAFVRARRARNDYAWSTFHLKASVSNDSKDLVYEDISLSGTQYERFAQDVTLKAGACTIAFETYGENVQNGPVAFIDDVSLSPVTAIGDVQDVTVNLARGSLLRLENVNPVHIQNVTVDGVPVNGGRGALKAAGVTITGAGKFTAGDSQGNVLFIR